MEFAVTNLSSANQLGRELRVRPSPDAREATDRMQETIEGKEHRETALPVSGEGTECTNQTSGEWASETSPDQKGGKETTTPYSSPGC